MATKDWLDTLPELRQHLASSPTWKRILEEFEVKDLGPATYMVRGDTFGDADDLAADVLSRGSSKASPDPLARQLFEELPQKLQHATLQLFRPE